MTPTSFAPIESATGYHVGAIRLLDGFVTLCDELQNAKCAVLNEKLRNTSGHGSTQWWLGKIKVDKAEIERQNSRILDDRLPELRGLLADLKRHDSILVTFETEHVRFRWQRTKGRRVPACLAGRFLADQRQSPPSSYHAALVDLVTGCLSELSKKIDDPKAATNGADEWTDVFNQVGGSWHQWLLALQAEEARSKELDQGLTEDEKRQKFCFEKWQQAWIYKEINAELKRHPLWEGFSNDTSVRGPIEAWAKRIGVSPRRGHRGRPKSTKSLDLT